MAAIYRLRLEQAGETGTPAMNRPDIEREIDALYQLPLDEFTRARNELARRVGRGGAGEIRSLSKPSIAAWAVNQVYWRDRRAYDALIEATFRLADAQRAALSGRKVDLRSTGRARDGAVDDAFERAMARLAESGHAASASTRESVRRTLESLPGPEPAGRLTEALSPSGFEALQGLTVGEATAGASARPGTEPRRPSRPAGRAEREEQRASTELQRKIFEAAREVRQLEAEAGRAAAASSRTEADLEKRKAEEGAAKEAWTAARARTGEAQESVETARRSARGTEKALERARKELERIRANARA